MINTDYFLKILSLKAKGMDTSFSITLITFTYLIFPKNCYGFKPAT